MRATSMVYTQCVTAWVAQVVLGKVKLQGSLLSMGLWAIAVAGDFDSPLYELLMTALPRFHSSELDAAALQRIHYVRSPSPKSR